MNRLIQAGLAAALLAAPMASTASAFPIDTRLAQEGVKPVQVRYGGWHRYHRGGWHHRGWRGHRGGYGVGAGLAGLAAGAVIGGALASSNAYGAPVYAPGPGPGSAVDYCMRRFKSYDPASGTYLGYDGDRHPCP